MIKVVRTTFETIVKDPTKDVFLMYYSPDDHSSKKFWRKWMELAEHV